MPAYEKGPMIDRIQLSRRRCEDRLRRTEAERDAAEAEARQLHAQVVELKQRLAAAQREIAQLCWLKRLAAEEPT